MPKTIKPQKNDDNQQKKDQPIYKEQKSIKKEEKSSSLKEYLSDTSAIIREHIITNKKKSKIYFSIISLICAAILITMFILIFPYNKMNDKLNDLTDIENTQQDILNAQRKKFFKEVFNNTDLYYLLDNNDMVASKLFDYSVVVNYNNEFSKFNKDNHNEPVPQVILNKNTNIVITVNEKYTTLAKSNLDVATLQRFSLFLTPFKTTKGDYIFKDYRTFLTIPIMSNYNYLDEYGNPNFYVETTSSYEGNTYSIYLNNFKVNENGIPSIQLNFDFATNDTHTDINQTPISGKYRKLSTDNDIDVIRDYAGQPFKFKLGKGTISEASSIINYIKTFTDKAEIDDKYLNNLGITNKLDMTYLMDGCVKLVDFITAQDMYYLELLKTPDKATAILPYIKLQLSNLKEKYTNFYINDYNKKAVTFLKDIFDKDFGLSDNDNGIDELTTLTSLINLDKNYTSLNENQTKLIDKIIGNYESVSLNTIKLTCYNIKSSLKTLDFNKFIKLNAVFIIIQ